jgi:hypothetical protein
LAEFERALIAERGRSDVALAKAPDQREAAPGTARAVPREPSLEALLASDRESAELNERPGKEASQRKSYRRNASWVANLPPMTGGSVQEKAMEPWKGTPKPAMAGNKPAMTGNKPSTSPVKPTQSSCCPPAPSAKKPTSKK